MSKHLKNIGIISGLTMVSRVLGLVRDSLTAMVFGSGILSSAFFTAFRLPNLFRRLLAEGSLTAAFVPILQEELRKNGRQGAHDLLSNVVCWLAVASTAIVAVAALIFGPLGSAPADGEKWQLVASLTVILFPYLVLVSLAAALVAALQVFDRFNQTALSPIWLNLAMITSLGVAGVMLSGNRAAILAITPEGVTAIRWLCAGALAGGFLQMAVPALVLYREGWRPRWNLTLSPGVRSVAKLMGPGIFGTAVYQVNQYVSQLLAYTLSDSAASDINYATRLMELPIGVFAIAVSTVVYPLIARHAAEQNFDDMAADYRKGLRLILLINVPAAAGLFLLGEPIVRILFEHGAFAPTSTLAVTAPLQIYAVGLAFFSVVSLTARAFYALRDTVTPVKIAAVNLVLNVALSLLLRKSLGVPGLALASTTAVVVQTFMLQRALTRRLPGLHFAPLWGSLGRVGLATAAMGLLVWGGWRGIQAVVASPKAASALAIALLIPLAAAVYGLGLWVLKIEGREEFVELARKFRGKGRK